MATIGALEVRIGVDARDFSAGIHQASQALTRMEGLADRAGRSIGTFNSRITSTVRSMKLATAGLTAAGGALALLVSRAMTAINTQRDLAGQLGSSIDSLRGLQIAAGDAGVSAEAMSGNVLRLNRRLGEMAATGGGPAAAWLTRLGLTARELLDIPLDERVAVIADRMKGLGSAAEVSSAAFAIFGDAGIRMVSMLREGGDAIRAARAEVDDFGLSLSAVDAAAVGRASNALARIGRTAEVAATRLTVTLAPAIEMTAQWFNELARANNGWRDAADAGADRIVRGLAYVADAALWAQRAYVALEIANQTWNATAIAGLRVVLGLLSQIPGMSAGWSDVLDDLATRQDAALAAVGTRLEQFHELMARPMPSGAILEAWEEARRGAADAIDGMSGIGGILPPVLEQIEELKNNFGDLRQDMARSIQIEQAGLFEALGQDERARALREEIELTDLLRRVQGELSEEQYGYLLQQLELMREIKAEREAALESVELERQAAAERVRIQADAERAIQDLRQGTFAEAVNLLGALGQHSKAAAIAGLALTKAQQIAHTAQATATASMLAYASQLIPGDPSSIARAQAAKSATIAMGRAQMALIAATGLAQGATIMSGGSVATGSGGGRAAAGGGSAAAGGGARQIVTIEGIDRNALFSGEQIVSLINEAQRRGAVIEVAR